MATKDTVQLGEEHAPHQASLDAFAAVIDEVREELITLRRDHDKHEPAYFAAVRHVSDHALASFTPADLESVRLATSAYGLHLFGKVRLPALAHGYVHVRIFGAAKDGTEGATPDDRVYSLHSIHTEEVVKGDGERVYRAVFGSEDRLEWFDT